VNYAGKGGEVEAAARARELSCTRPRAPPFIGRGSRPWRAGHGRREAVAWPCREGYGLLLADGLPRAGADRQMGRGRLGRAFGLGPGR
jgi:hypothetical protein